MSDSDTFTLATLDRASLTAERLIPALRILAEEAGYVILGFYGDKEDMGVRVKDDESPVTAADEAAESFILEHLASLTPDIPVIAEEAAAKGDFADISGGLFWLVDPLDGTKEFINRNGEFTVNIALIEDGRPIAGVVHAPALNKTWVGARGLRLTGHVDGRGAFFAEADNVLAPITTRAVPAQGATAVASRRHGSGEKLEACLKRHNVVETTSAGSSLKFCLLATGEADLYPRFGRTMEWDTAAGQAVLESAGGRVETVNGAPLGYAKNAIFENPEFIAYGWR